MSRIDERAVARKTQDADQRKNFGRRRGQWLDQVYNDPTRTGDRYLVATAITSHLNSRAEDLSCFPGDVRLAEISRVSTKTVQRTLKWAVDRGHITLGPWSQHTPRKITLILQTGQIVHSETGQIVHSEKPQTGLQSGLQSGHSFRGSLVESTGPAPKSCNSLDSQEKKEAAAPPSLEDSEGVPDDDGHKSESPTASDNLPAAPGIKKESSAAIESSSKQIKKSESSDSPLARVPAPPTSDLEARKAKAEEYMRKYEKAKGADEGARVCCYAPTRMDEIRFYRAKVIELGFFPKSWDIKPNGKRYAFEGQTIRLTWDDYRKWVLAYPYLDLEKELEGLDRWVGRRYAQGRAENGESNPMSAHSSNGADSVIGFVRQCINTGKWGGFIGNPDDDSKPTRFVGAFRSQKEASEAVFLALMRVRGRA